MKSPRLAMLLACFAFAAPAFRYESSIVVQAAGTIEYAFTPGDDAVGLIVRTIDAATSKVLVQAFSFTHRDIADARKPARPRCANHCGPGTDRVDGVDGNAVDS
jgi:hypothetical protein